MVTLRDPFPSTSPSPQTHARPQPRHTLCLASSIMFFFQPLFAHFLFSSQEMIHLQDPSYKMMQERDDESRKTAYWMSTLRISMGMRVHSLDLRRQLNVSIGGYFMIAQMLGFTQSLLSLDISGSGLRADEAGVLAMGLYSNRSLKVTCLSRWAPRRAPRACARVYAPFAFVQLSGPRDCAYGSALVTEGDTVCPGA
jgi:hypothetical protein